MLSISYNKPWKLKIDKNMNKAKLHKEVGISSNAMAKLNKNKSVQLDIFARICEKLYCDIGDRYRGVYSR
ncbi:MAG: helix-turn-helix domain-containing protein [Beduini sp.]|uniref:helix-turn-helix domain-containing protein n=1 Tax=Beduini sp. TaxID=1922300 RepID=UPI0039A3796E